MYAIRSYYDLVIRGGEKGAQGGERHQPEDLVGEEAEEEVLEAAQQQVEPEGRNNFV